MTSPIKRSIYSVFTSLPFYHLFYYFHIMKNASLLIILFLINQMVIAQSKYPMDSVLFSKYQYRSIGPFRGGRASGVCGDYKNKQVFYMGATGGGVWQTKDGGSNWKNISDKYFGGSIGSVEVCPTDPLLIYAGMGENILRGNVSEGRGMWKTTNGGKTSTHVGLDDTRHITKVLFNPRNPEVVYCAATGHLFGTMSNGAYSKQRMAVKHGSISYLSMKRRVP